MNKKFALILSALVGMVFLSGSLRAEGNSLGAALAYGGDWKAVGIEGRFYYDFPGSKNLRLAANFTYFFVDSPFTFWTIDGNVHYAFASFSGGRAYGVGGLDIAHSSVEGFSGSSTDLGINLGAGVEGDVTFGAVFGEVKAVLGNASEIVLTGGLRFALK